MKRLALAIALLALPAVSFAFDTDPKHTPTVGVLMTRAERSWAPDDALGRAVEARLVHELKARGFEAVQTRTTWEDERESAEARFDVLIELSSPRATHENLGGIVVAGQSGGADVSVVQSHASIVVHVYDGRTMEPIDDATTVDRTATGVAPTGIGIGDRHFGLWISLPFARYARQRALAQGIAEEAASQIAGALRMERVE